jgi:hypothetical protein
MSLPLMPVGTAAVPRLPHGRTAMRLSWRFLPREVRELVESHLGGPVVEAVSQDGGYTPGFASVLTSASGQRLFVKAASRVAQADFAASYAEEARKLQILDGTIPAPRLEWVHDDDGWVVLGFEAVDARAPRRPWRQAELDRALDLAEAIAESTQDLPDGLGLRPVAEDLPELVTGWDAVPDTWPHRDDARALAQQVAALPDQQFAHCDLRDDNILFAADGRILACDWNWPVVGPRWLDLVDLLVSARGDGLEVDALLSARDLTREVDPEHIDVWLAAFSGYMLARRTRPAPSTSPHLRALTDWQAEAAWSWLAQRRGWA